MAELGEFGVIDRITADRPQPEGTLLGPGDDAAVVAAPDGRVVATVDTLVQGVHFRLDWSGPEQVGRKAVAANLADIAAMGAVPTALLLSLACPASTSADVVDGLASGIWDAASEAGIGVVGGDTVAADQIVVSITALGDLEGRAPVRRSGAKVGDVVAVRGVLGWSAAGMEVLRRGFRSPLAMVAAHRTPRPPFAEGPVAATAGATAMVDTSDGLLADALAESRAPRHRVDAAVVYHDACHLGHAQKIRNQPRDVLRSIPGVELTELPEAEICCGSAGIYNMLQPEAAGDLGRRKADNIRGTGADLLVTANPGCLLQIRKYLEGELPMLHPVQLLDASIRGVRPPGL